MRIIDWSSDVCSSDLFDHYPAWREDIGDSPLLHVPGAFGENISTRGLDEDNVCLGDRFELGTALLEVRQGRQPCWKLNDRFGVPDLVRRVQSSGITGWSYSQLRPHRHIVASGRTCAGVVDSG